MKLTGENKRIILNKSHSIIEKPGPICYNEKGYIQSGSDTGISFALIPADAIWSRKSFISGDLSFMDIIKKFEPLFGEWIVESLIGAGSFGRVYKAYREEFGERYYSAIKYISIPADEYEVTSLRDDGMDDESIGTYYTALAKDVAAETRLMSKLKGYSNIVSYEDSRVIPKANGYGYDIFIRMELLESLSERTRKASFSQDDVIALGIDICTALEVCGEQGIIHRDIKPDNIFINSHGDYKLGDFGIARQLEKTATFMSKKGTYNYMAPEVYKGEKYGATCDLYSLGLVMYRLLSNGRLPFLPPAPQVITPSDRENAIIRRMRGDNLPAPCNTDGELSKIVLKACAYLPEDRYSSADEMRDALINCLSAEHSEKTVTESEIVFNDPCENSCTESAYEKDKPEYSGETVGVFPSITPPGIKKPPEADNSSLFDTSRPETKQLDPVKETAQIKQEITNSSWPSTADHFGGFAGGKDSVPKQEATNSSEPNTADHFGGFTWDTNAAKQVTTNTPESSTADHFGGFAKENSYPGLAGASSSEQRGQQENTVTEFQSQKKKRNAPIIGIVVAAAFIIVFEILLASGVLGGQSNNLIDDGIDFWIRHLIKP